MDESAIAKVDRLREQLRAHCEDERSRVVYEQLFVTTERPGLRAEIVGWTHEDPRLVRPGHIGRTPAPRPHYTPDCVLRALADGWRLTGDPQRLDEGWSWHLERPVLKRSSL